MKLFNPSRGVLGVMVCGAVLAGLLSWSGPVHAAPGEGAEAAALPVVLGAHNPKIQYTGRFDDTERAGRRCDWSNSAVTVRFNGTDMNATLSSDNADVRWQVAVDGKPTEVLKLDSRLRAFRVADNLPAGIHVVTLVQRTEPFCGATLIHGFAINKGATLLDAPARHFKIEVIGDSISCGYGDEATDQTKHFSCETENSYLTYGAIAARELGASYVCIAWSGRLMWPTDTMPSIYDRTLATEPASHWKFTGPRPDAIVINLGTNDIRAKDGFAPEPAWTHAYEQFIRHLREHDPKAMIYCTVGPMVTVAQLPGRAGLEQLTAYLHRIVSDCHAAGDQRVQFLAFAPQLSANGYGADWHPSLKTHVIMAQTLVQRIQADFPDLSAATRPENSHRTQAMPGRSLRGVSP